MIDKTRIESTIDRVLTDALPGTPVGGIRDLILDALDGAGFHIVRKPRPVGNEQLTEHAQQVYGAASARLAPGTGKSIIGNVRVGPDNGEGPEYVDIPNSRMKQRRRRSLDRHAGEHRNELDEDVQSLMDRDRE